MSARIVQFPARSEEGWLAKQAREAREYLESLPADSLGPAARILLGRPPRDVHE